MYGNDGTYNRKVGCFDITDHVLLLKFIPTANRVIKRQFLSFLSDGNIRQSFKNTERMDVTF